MKILEYDGLDPSRVRAQYQKVRDAIERDDFHQAEVKKLANVTHGKYYRAKLDASNRLLFTFVRCGDSTYALMLEIIEHHAYDKSRFLRGASVDETRLPAIEIASAAREADAIRYVHPEKREVHLLDKVLSFNDVQEAIFRLPAPLIIVGSAGSGKTALTLEKLKHVEGDVLYVTHSSYLVQCARNLYFSHGFERSGQEPQFLSYRDFLESLHVVPGREAGWPEFARWFTRQQQAFKGIDAHQVFEELRGVITADAKGVLTRDDYLTLGIRQSIFEVGMRERVYDLFERYRLWLGEAELFDINLLAHAWHRYATPQYDFIVIDEVQDLTSAQLALVLAALKKPDQFLLCGDSNQIVHPNFFSWSKIKTLFWRDERMAETQELRILRTNFRNGRDATRVANNLLKIKHRRFGSIDRESNFLVDAVGEDTGSVTVLGDKDAVKKDLNQKTRQSTRFAILVMRDEDKAEVKRFFQTPLVFSIHEAKGLEYENIILYRFVANHRAEYAEIADGVCLGDLETDTLEYRRAKDKTDKSLEIFKFYVNALYVALTRATHHVYLIESDHEHPLLRLLSLTAATDQVNVNVKASSLEEWQKEARRLELQGKQEQADAIHAQVLKQAPVPWPVFDEARLRETLTKVFREQLPGNKAKQQLYEYAAFYDEPVLAYWLARHARFDNAERFGQLHASMRSKHLHAYATSRFKDILQQCERHGINHRTAMNQTPLMAAAAAGNVALVETLLDQGADPESVDHFGRNALHWAMLQAFRDGSFAKGPFPAIYDRIAPAAVDVQSGERLVRIHKHLSEYFLFQTLWALFASRFTYFSGREWGGFEASAILEAWQNVPRSVLRPERNKRSHLSGVLARNEIHRDYAYNRFLFVRLTQGWYQFNPRLSVRGSGISGDGWRPVVDALNLRLVAETANPNHWSTINQIFADVGQAPMDVPLGGEAAARELEEWRRRIDALQRTGR